jgi:hypothetical protein
VKKRLLPGNYYLHSNKSREVYKSQNKSLLLGLAAYQKKKKKSWQHQPSTFIEGFKRRIAATYGARDFLFSSLLAIN